MAKRPQQIRVALGAKREQVMRKMLLDGMRPAVFGLVVGLAASLEAGQLMRDYSMRSSRSIRRFMPQSP